MLEKLEQLQKELDVIYIELSEIAKSAEMSHDESATEALWIKMLQTRTAKEQLNYAINNIAEVVENLQDYCS